MNCEQSSRGVEEVVVVLGPYRGYQLGNPPAQLGYLGYNVRGCFKGASSVSTSIQETVSPT